MAHNVVSLGVLKNNNAENIENILQLSSQRFA